MSFSLAECILPSTFTALLSPIASCLKQQGAAIDEQAGSRKLFFEAFVRILLFGITCQIGSLRKLVTELRTSPTAAALDLPATPFSTLKEGFERFPYSAFALLFSTLLAEVPWLAVPELAALGTLWLVDGSLFPMLASMHWANYRQHHNALRLPLAWELNRMIPVEFALGEGSSNERSFLASIVQQGITYVADRGYVCFKLFSNITTQGAFFVIRAKSNLRFTPVKALPIAALAHTRFEKVNDTKVTLDNDHSAAVYRLIRFRIAQTPFLLLTNRWDLDTFQIILIYAYRWQIELVFRFLKRTLNGLHLFNQSPNGVHICFYALLELRLKQLCVQQQEHQTTPLDTSSSDETVPGRKNPKTQILDTPSPTEFIYHIGQQLKTYWKLSCHWLITLKNLLARPFDDYVIKQLGYG